MGKNIYKIAIECDTNGGFNEIVNLYVESSRSSDYIYIYDILGNVILSGTDDFMYKLGLYLTGNKNNQIEIEEICELPFKY